MGPLLVTDGAPLLTLANLLALNLRFDKYLVTVALIYFDLQLGFLSFHGAWCESGLVELCKPAWRAGTAKGLALHPLVPCTQ